jgi:hypothetical protein
MYCASGPASVFRRDVHVSPTSSSARRLSLPGRGHAPAAGPRCPARPLDRELHPPIGTTDKSSSSYDQLEAQVWIRHSVQAACRVHEDGSVNKCSFTSRAAADIICHVHVHVCRDTRLRKLTLHRNCNCHDMSATSTWPWIDEFVRTHTRPFVLQPRRPFCANRVSRAELCRGAARPSHHHDQLIVSAVRATAPTAQLQR